MNNKALIAEFLGTFCLALVVGSTVASEFPVATPFIAALCLGMFVYTIGGISGCHINPAVTCGLMAVKKISVPDGLGYIVAQVLGAVSAGALLGISASGGSALPATDVAMVGLGEMLGMFFFTFGISAVVLGKVPEAMSGVVVGGSLLLGIAVASHLSAGVLNPAVSIGISSFGISIPYLVGPIVGSVLGFLAGNFMGE